MRLALPSCSRRLRSTPWANSCAPRSTRPTADDPPAGAGTNHPSRRQSMLDREETITAAAMLRRTLLQAGAATAAGLALTPIGALAQAAAEPRRGGTLLVSTTVNPTSLDPMMGRINTDMVMLYALYD